MPDKRNLADTGFLGRTMPALIRYSAVSRTDSRSGRGVQPSSRTAFSAVTSCWMPSMSTPSFASPLKGAAARTIQAGSGRVAIL